MFASPNTQRKLKLAGCIVLTEYVGEHISYLRIQLWTHLISSSYLLPGIIAWGNCRAVLFCSDGFGVCLGFFGCLFCGLSFFF